MDVNITLGLITAGIAVLGYAYARYENHVRKNSQINDQLHSLGLSVAELKYEIAKEYATKKELQLIISEMKSYFDGRFDKLEAKIYKKE